MRPVARTIAGMKRSGIREIMDLAASSPGVMHLEVGQPDFDTPAHIVEAAAWAAANGYTRYTPNKGLIEVREAMARKIAERNGFAVDVEQVVVTTGAVNAIMQALMVICEPGEAILVPDPSWPNYTMMAAVLDAPVARYPLVPSEGFTPDLDALEQVCRTTPNAKAIVVNTPGNPTGAVYDRGVLEAMLDIAVRHDLFVISDECYEDIVFDGAHTSLGALDRDGRVMSTFSVSKSYAMTGWRIGYAAATRELAALISKLQEAVTSCATAVAQKAAEAAITGDQACVAEMRDSYRVRRDRAVELLESAGLLLSRPRGAFYIMADTSSTGMDGYDLCRWLISEHGVAVAPGETFGPSGAGMVRISLATALDDLTEGITRLASAVHGGP